MMPRVLACEIDTHHVRMVEFSGRRGLGVETAYEIFVASQFGRQVCKRNKENKV